MVARPKLKLRGGHDLRLYSANVTANRDQVFGGSIKQVMAAQAESVNLFRREGKHTQNNLVVFRFQWTLQENQQFGPIAVK